MLSCLEMDQDSPNGRDCLMRLPGGGFAMLAEKFFLYLEAQDQTHGDGSPRVISSSPHVPVRLPERK